MFVLLALLLPALMAHTNRRSELAADVTGSIWLIKWLDVIGYRYHNEGSVAGPGL